MRQPVICSPVPALEVGHQDKVESDSCNFSNFISLDALRSKFGRAVSNADERQTARLTLTTHRGSDPSVTRAICSGVSGRG